MFTRLSLLFLLNLAYFNLVSQNNISEEILVKFNSSATNFQIQQNIISIQGEILDYAPLSQIYRIRVPLYLWDEFNSQGMFDPNNGANNLADVDDISTNSYIYGGNVGTNSYIDISPQEYSPFYLHDMNLYPSDIDYSFGQRKVKVAVIDSGVSNTNTIIKSFLTKEWSYTEVDIDSPPYVSNVTDSSFSISNAHGSAVAGLIAATVNSHNSQSLDLRSYKVINDFGYGTLFGVVKGIEEAILDGAEIINLSIGYTPGLENVYGDLFLNVLNLSKDYKVLFICSAGNDGSNLGSYSYFPASLTPDGHHLIIGATDEYGQISTWSNFSNTHTDILAPGTNILHPTYDNRWSYSSGTSFSTPIISTLGISISSKDQSWNLDQVYCEIIESVSDVSNSLLYSKYGTINTSIVNSCDFNYHTQEEISINEKNHLVESLPVVTIYPNPAFDRIYVKIPNIGSLHDAHLYDINLNKYKLKYSTKFDENLVELDVGKLNLPIGSYYLRLIIGDNIINKILVISSS